MSKFDFVSEKDYRVFAGPDWPSFSEFQQGIAAAKPEIQTEIAEFVGMMYQTFQELNPAAEWLGEANQQRQRQTFFDKQYRPNACRIPWNTLGINANGHAFICSSPSWVPRFVGNIVDAPDIWAVLNSETAQQIRQEIYHGRYFYCNNTICSFFSKQAPDTYQSVPVANHVPMQFDSRPEYQVTEIPSNLIFDFDYTCNFRCPSCRTEVINNNKHHVIRETNNRVVAAIKREIIDRIGSQPVSIRWAGGEPFISEPYLELLEYIGHTGRTNITHIIQTNGSYLKSKKELVTQLLPTVSELRISFDAATAETYGKIRVNGQWQQLLENAQWVIDHVRQQGLATRISADFVVQRDNYQEIPAFESLCYSLGIGYINYQKMWNWGTWPDSEFDLHNVYNPQHAEYPQLLKIFQDIGKPVIDETTK